MEPINIAKKTHNLTVPLRSHYVTLSEWMRIHYVGVTCQNLKINVYISFYTLQVCKKNIQIRCV